MPRRARLLLPGVPRHIIQRGNNRLVCFHCADDYRFYLEWLTEYAGKSHCRIHAYVLMTNLKLTGAENDGECAIA